MYIDLISVFIRALSLVLVLQAAGVALFVVLFGRDLSSTAAISRLAQWSAGGAVVLVLLHQLLDAGRMAGEFSGLFDPFLQRLAFTSSSAAANGVRILGLLGLMVAPRFGGKAAVVAGALICASFLFTGHTAVHAQQGLLAPLLWLHLAVAAFWLGALLPLVIISQQEPAALAADIVSRFSRIAVWVVPSLLLAGLAMAWLLLPDLGVLWEPYGLLLLTKLLGFSLLMAFAAWNKWRLGPAIATGDAQAVSAFRRSVIAEFVVICAVLAATAAMTGLFSPEAP